MRVRVVGAAAAGGSGFALSTFVLDDVLAVDAGALGWFAEPADQARIRDILLTHAHIDHIAGLAGYIENVYQTGPEPPCIHAPQPVLDSLQAHLFNDQLMPDFIALSRTLPPFFRFCPLAPGQPYAIRHYKISTWTVDHPVPTVAYLVDDGSTAAAFITDTAPVPAVVRQIAVHPRLRAVFLEASFPDELADLAVTTKHLTASQFIESARLFPSSVPVHAIHVKPRYAEAVRRQILSAGLANARVAEPLQLVDLK
jgi:ribonuclease BN (tRNA processing enzyme)